MKTTWFRSRKKVDHYREDTSKKKTKVVEEEVKLENKTVLFVEYTDGGELASRLRELCRSLAPTLGFGVKVVEGRKEAEERIPTHNLVGGRPMWEGRDLYNLLPRSRETIHQFVL